MYRYLLPIALLLSACAATVNKSGTEDLAGLVGTRVELRGAIGIGKLSDFVLVSGVPVYLVGGGSETGKIPEGTTVLATGTLQYLPATNDFDPGNGVASIPAHFFISSAHVTVVP